MYIAFRTTVVGLASVFGCASVLAKHKGSALCNELLPEPSRDGLAFVSASVLGLQQPLVLQQPLFSKPTGPTVNVRTYEHIQIYSPPDLTFWELCKVWKCSKRYFDAFGRFI